MHGNIRVTDRNYEDRMPSRYSPEKKTIGNLLSMTNPPIVVPEWQRNYSWTTSEVETFWEDLLSFSALYPGNNILDQEYFLGSIVLVDNKISHLLLDGQQRLATSEILLSVIRDYLKRYSSDAATRTSSRFLTDFDDAQDRYTYKLTLNRYDRDFFRREILESRGPDYEPMGAQIVSHRLIRQARKFFEKRFDEQYASLANPAESYQWTLRIQNVLTNYMSVVAVVSGDEDQAANVFETLNDRGIGLSTPDLLRNLVLRRANADHLEETIDLWGEILEIESDANLNYFIRHYWISYEGDIKTQSLYRAIKSKIINDNIQSLSFSRQVRDASVVYREIVSGQSDDEEIVRLLEGVKELGANVLYPALLSVFQKSELEEAKNLLRALIATFIRHNVIGGLESSQLETVVFSLAKEIRDGSSVDKCIEKLRTFAPEDARFRETFKTAIIARRGTIRYVLRELELAARQTEELDVAAPNRVHVEHIYPQTPKNAEHRWPNHSGVINRIGNQTLLSRKLNVAIRNGSFEEKKPAYNKSEILITNKLADLDDWDAAALATRQAELADQAPLIWSL